MYYGDMPSDRAELNELIEGIADACQSFGRAMQRLDDCLGALEVLLAESNELRPELAAAIYAASHAQNDARYVAKYAVKANVPTDFLERVSGPLERSFAVLARCPGPVGDEARRMQAAREGAR